MSNAILFVHGIIGRPEHFEPFLKYIPKDWTIKNLKLKGHGGSPRNFSKVCMEDWQRQVDEELEKLRLNHDKCFVVGHSMGTLFAINESRINRIDGLFLLNVPLGVHLYPSTIKMLYSVFMDEVDPDNDWLMAAKNGYAFRLDKNLLHYISWLFRYAELFRLIRQTRGIIDQIDTPAMAIVSGKDEMVSSKTTRVLKEKSHFMITELPESGHLYYPDEERVKINEQFKKFIKLAY